MTLLDKHGEEVALTKAATPAEALGGCLVLLIPILWVSSCVFDGQQKAVEAKPESQKIQSKEVVENIWSRKFRDDPLIAAATRRSPNGDGFAYAIRALGQRCVETISVTPIERPMLYEVICTTGSSGAQLNFVKYRMDTVKRISDLVS